jgi:hypothetical protein
MLEQGSTQNLMDYSTGTELWKYQWDYTHNPEGGWFVFEDSEEGGFLYGITWLGNYLWGLAPDNQEGQIEADRMLFKYVYQNYDDYFNKSKIKDTNLEIEKYKNWSARKSSHQGTAKKVFNGFKIDKTTFSLFNEGIYFEDYTLEGKNYKFAIYSKIEGITLNKDIRLKSFTSLRYNTSIKVGYTVDYGLIVFYDASGNMQMAFQIIGGNSPKEAVIKWVNYLGLILQSEEQQEEDKENSIQKILKSVQLYALEKLNEIWGEEEAKYEDVMLNNVKWVSQFDPVISNGCSSGCCWYTSDYILKQTTGKGAPQDAANDIAVLASASDYNTLVSTGNFENRLSYLEGQIVENGSPVVVGVHYFIADEPYNTNKATRHFFVIVGKGYDPTTKSNYFRYYEVGTNPEHEENRGKHENNRLNVDKKKKLLSGKRGYDTRFYTVTEIRISK